MEQVIVNEVSQYLDILSLLKISKLDPNYKKIVDNYEYNIKKIQKLVRYNRLDFLKYLFFEEELEFISKKNLIRIYLIYYPEDYLLNFPKFFVNKIKKYSHYLNNDQIHILENYLEIHKNKKRTRRYVKNFLEHSFIKKDMILYAGW